MHLCFGRLEAWEMILILRSHSGEQEPLENLIFHFGLSFLLLLLVIMIIWLLLLLLWLFHNAYFLSIHLKSLPVNETEKHNHPQ